MIGVLILFCLDAALGLICLTSASLSIAFELKSSFICSSKLLLLRLVCSACLILLVALPLAPWISFYRVYKFFKLGENAELLKQVLV